MKTTLTTVKRFLRHAVMSGEIISHPHLPTFLSPVLHCAINAADVIRCKQSPATPVSADLNLKTQACWTEQRQNKTLLQVSLRCTVKAK